MAQHVWGETDFDWCALNDCTIWFPTQLQRWGRISISSCKEKYGTMRLEFFYWGSHYDTFLHSLIWPGYLFIQWPEWPRRLVDNEVTRASNIEPYSISIFYDIDNIVTYIANKCGLSKLVSLYQRFVFNMVTLRAVKKWPHIKDEILNEYEFQELLYDHIKALIGYEDKWV